MTRRKIEYWVIPPDSDGEFVAHMEEVLDTYERTKPLRGGKDRDRAPEPLASATGPIDSDFAHCLSRGTAPCYAPA